MFQNLFTILDYQVGFVNKLISLKKTTTKKTSHPRQVK